MKTILLLLFSFLMGQNGFCQESSYRAFRAKTSVPPYSLQKIKALIKSAPQKETNPDEIPDGILIALSEKNFNQLSVREQFTYTMIHPEVYAQNCSIFISPPGEDKKIFGYLVSWTNEESWSDRQREFLKKNRDTVMALIKESVTRSRHMGVNYKDAIVEIKGWEMIPFIIDYYQNNKKDKDALTMLMLLMKEGKYSELMQSPSYKKLYAAENYESFIDFNKANEALIINRAERFYNQKTGNVRLKN